MTTSSKRKGDRAELEVAGILADLLGYPVRRMLGAGRSEDDGDLYGIPDCTAQVKNYSNITAAIAKGLADLDRQQAHTGTTFGVVFIRRPAGRWIAVLDIPRWATLYREATA